MALDPYKSTHTGAEIDAGIELAETAVQPGNLKTVAGESVVGSGNISITKSTVGLGNVDNTSDLSKPVSAAQANAIADAVADRPVTATVEAIAAMNASEAVQDHVAEDNPHEQYTLANYNGNVLAGFKNKDNTDSAFGQIPVSVSGSFEFGGVLTAVLASGWAVTGYQWTRDGVDISGATSSTYTPVSADIGKVVTVRVTGLSMLDPSNPPVAYNGPPLLRIASPYNRSATEIVSAAAAPRRVAARLYRPIGSSDKKSIGIRLDNWYFNTGISIAGPGGALNIVGAYIECNNISVPLTFSGNPTVSLTNAQYDVVSDMLNPSAFGLTSFTRGTAARIRIEYEAPIGSGIPVAGAVDLIDTCRQYDPAVASCTNLSGTGALTFSGTTTSTTVPFVTLIGENVNVEADARAWIGSGDSIFWQSSTQSYFMAALEGANVANQLISGIVLGRSGGSSLVVNNHPAVICSFAKYANGVVDDYATNDITSTSVATLTSRARTNWANFRANKSTHPFSRDLIIIRNPLLMKTTGTFTTLAGQTVSADWNAGNKAEQFDTAMLAEQGVAGGCDIYAGNVVTSPNLIRGSASGKGTTGSDWYKWTPNSTTDGVHPVAAGASGVNGLGANLRVYLTANA